MSIQSTLASLVQNTIQTTLDLIPFNSWVYLRVPPVRNYLPELSVGRGTSGCYNATRRYPSTDLLWLSYVIIGTQDNATCYRIMCARWGCVVWKRCENRHRQNSIGIDDLKNWCRIFLMLKQKTSLLTLNLTLWFWKGMGKLRTTSSLYPAAQLFSD